MEMLRVGYGHVVMLISFNFTGFTEQLKKIVYEMIEKGHVAEDRYYPPTLASCAPNRVTHSYAKENFRSRRNFGLTNTPGTSSASNDATDHY